MERLAAVPGGAGAAAACCLSLESDWRTSMQLVGRPLEIGVDDVPSERLVSPTYFDVLRIPMLRGRAFQDADAPASLPVAIINQTMARRFWPDRDPLGEQVRQLTADIYRVMAIGAQSRSSPCSSGLRS